MISTKIPSEIIVHSEIPILELAYENETSKKLSFEFLRVYSPSAEVTGHGQPTIQVGKKQVKIQSVETVGNYALKINFSDGHDTGIYSWKYFIWLYENYEKLWDQYLEKLKSINGSREKMIKNKEDNCN